MIENIDDILVCSKHGAYAKSQIVCPRCDKKLTEAPKNGGTRVLATMPSVLVSKTEKAPKITPTVEKLSIPIAKHGAIIHYIRWDITEAKSIEKDRPRKIRAYWYDGYWFSELELWFWRKWKSTGYPMPKPEHKFHPDKKWKFDFAWLDNQIALELEGGIYSNGRHTRASGFKNDIEKYNEATRLGWRLFRFAGQQDKHIQYMKRCLDTLSEAA